MCKKEIKLYEEFNGFFLFIFKKNVYFKLIQHKLHKMILLK